MKVIRCLVQAKLQLYLKSAVTIRARKLYEDL